MYHACTGLVEGSFRESDCPRKIKKVHLNGAAKKGNKMELFELFEIIMIVSFGASWPLNVMKSYRARTTKGKSLPFLLLIFFGYIAGIISKFANETYMADIGAKWYVLFFYVLNFIMVGADLVMYVRNYRLDMKAKVEKEA